MAITCFFSIIEGAGLSALLCAIGWVLVYFFQGPDLATEFVKAFVVKFDGILVGATTYGLLFFTMARGRELLADLNEILVIPDAYQEDIAELHKRSVSPSWIKWIVIPLTAIGSFVFWLCGFPLYGFAKIYLALCVNSVWFAASVVLAYLIFSLRMFDAVDKFSAAHTDDQGINPGIKTRPGYSPAREALDDFLTICPALGLAAIYIAFRAAKAGFNGVTDPLLHSLLLLPIALYLPAALLYSFHPRYVMQQVFERDLMPRFDQLERDVEAMVHVGVDVKVSLTKNLYDLKEKMLTERSPLLSLKDAPSLTVALLILRQFLPSDLSGILK